MTAREIRATSLLLLLAASGCSHSLVKYTGPNPAPGAITAFDPRWSPDTARESKAGAPPFLVPGSTDRRSFRIGTLQVPPEAESVTVIVYGDNRPGIRMMTTSWGLPAIMDIGSPDPRRFAWAILNIPVFFVQGVVPRLDLFQDLRAMLWTHHYTGGNEKGVVAAIMKELPVNFVVNTGDLVEQGRNAGQAEAFVKTYAPLRTRVPFLAAPGNHERLWSKEGSSNWESIMGPPAQPHRYWFAVDFPESLARFVFLDSEELADPHNRYPDSLEAAEDDAQIKWADSALAVPARWKFLVLHHPLVTSGHYLSDWKFDDSNPAQLRRRARLLEICRRRRVTAVFSGHEHLYLRTYVRGPDGRGFWHITSGGGGAPLYRVSARERRAALNISLPDSSLVTWTNVRSVYHYCKLSIVRHPKLNEDSCVLEVKEVDPRGHATRLDYVNLAIPPKEEKREPLTAKP
jgi:hypothetical protein